MFSKHLIHLQITESVSLLNCCVEVSGLRKKYVLPADDIWSFLGEMQNKYKAHFIHCLCKLPET